MQLIDDSLYEDEEEFSVEILPNADTLVNPRFNRTLVIIKPDVHDGKYDDL